MHLLRDEDRHSEDFRWQFNGATARATATQAAETNVHEEAQGGENACMDQ